MVPACKDLGVMAVCGQEVAPTTLTPCHLRDGASARSVCRGGIEVVVRTGSHRSTSQGAPAWWGAPLYFRTTQK